MEWNWLVPVLIVASISIGCAFNNWVRARHGYPLEDDKGRLVPKVDDEHRRAVELLVNENARLIGQVTRLEARLATVERIVTDPAARVSAEIDALR